MPKLRVVVLSVVLLVMLAPTACTTAPAPTPSAVPTVATAISATPTLEPTSVPKPIGAFESGQYRNLFAELLGKSDAEIQQKIDQAWQQLFYGDKDTQRVYYPVRSDMAYIKDIANDDIRSEGMSYGMMLAVQLDKKEEFDRLWKWANTYMLQKDGPYKGYFAWHARDNGEQIDAGPAPDGEEWFTMALMFAANRWGNGEGIYNYQAEAQKILDTMLHKDEENTGLATNMFDPKTKQVVFVPSGNGATFTDPSYHLPAFYELWARWADKDTDFWKEVAQASRAFLKTAANPQTGLMPDYAEFDGKPNADPSHKDFRFDAFRNASNVALDWSWFAADPWEVEQSNRLLDFFRSQGLNNYVNQYSIDGKPLSGERSSGLIAMNAVAGLAADPQRSKDFVQALWDMEIPSGQYRYYDGLLYFLALLQSSGNYRIYTPEGPKSIHPTPTPSPINKAKFTPPEGQVLLGVGQDVNEVQAYTEAVGSDPGAVASDTALPGLKGLTEKTDTGSGVMFVDGLVKNHPNSALILGLNLADSLAALNKGDLDQTLDRLLDYLAALKRPVFLRLGYDFDKAQNQYDPEQYKQAWIKFEQRLKEKQIANVALVWQSATDCQGRNNSNPLEAWYPGDEYVDWVGASYFAPAACDFKPVNEVLDFARQHGKPAMIAESTPLGYDIGQLTYSTDGQTFQHTLSSRLWKEWFVPFFDFIGNNTDVIRAVTYLNAPWNTFKQWGPPYANGYRGDARVQDNPGVLEKWKAAITNAGYWQATPDLFKNLGYTP